MRLTTVFSASAALGLAVGMAVVVMPAPARAADDEVPVDQKVYRSIMEGLGLKRDGEATIQLTPGGRAKNKKQQAAKTDNGYDAPASGFGSQLMPSQLGSSAGSVWDAMFGNKKEETAKFTGEPPRASLTEPPPGYQTPSPDQPYGIGKAAVQKPTDYYTTHSEPSR